MSTRDVQNVGYSECLQIKYRHPFDQLISNFINGPFRKRFIGGNHHIYIYIINEAYIRPKFRGISQQNMA